MSWNKWFFEQNTKINTFRISYPKLHNKDSRFLSTTNCKYINFVSNDYLGLSNHPKLIEVLSASAKNYGAGSTGAVTMSGYSEIQEELQNLLASWLNHEKCLIFNSGYQLNSTLYSQIADNNTFIWLDKRCHASHIDGILLAKQTKHTKFYTFTPSTINKLIDKITSMPSNKHIILSEGIFSMDGTCTYLDQIINLRKNFDNIFLVIDDAHGIGATGKNGCGSLALGNAILLKSVDLLIGTMGKSLGTHGGFICGNKNVIEYLSQTVRGRIFTTCLPPCILACTIESINILNSEKGELLRNKLHDNIVLFKKLCKTYSLPLLNDESNNSPIQLLNFQKQETSVKTDQEEYIKYISNNMREGGILTGMICYPTVAKGKPRIRISLNSSHTTDDIMTLCKKFSQYV